jgi:signal transduction histidine kinase
MSNILSNAAKYSEQGDVVDIHTTLEAGKVVVGVTDYGQGMPESFKDRIFTKFAQADTSDSREKEGTGLGLYLTKRMVEKHDGEITYETVQGKGTTFYIKFPQEKE